MILLSFFSQIILKKKIKCYVKQIETAYIMGVMNWSIFVHFFVFFL